MTIQHSLKMAARSEDRNALSKIIYQINKDIGWWDDPNRCILTTLQLINTEGCEATEGVRKDSMDDHLPHRKMVEVELADALTRTLDLGGRFKLKCINKSSIGFDTVRYLGWSCTGLNSKALSEVPEPVQHLAIAEMVLKLAHCVECNSLQSMSWVEDTYSALIETIVWVAKLNGYDIWGALYEKVLYNMERPDHKRENRVAPGGKKI